MRSLFVALIIFSSIAYSADWKSSGSGQLVELYTSEGCSSCPPADLWISNLKKHPQLWESFVPVTFHVDYWDGLGWPDKFAASEFTARQRRYSKLWNKNNVYTPAIVIQGREASKSQQFEKSNLVLSGEWNGSHLVLSAKNIPEGSIVRYAWLGTDIISQIKRGENSGKTLQHNFVVLELGDLGTFTHQKELKLSLPANPISPAKALAVWLKKNHKPLVAIGAVL